MTATLWCESCVNTLGHFQRLSHNAVSRISMDIKQQCCVMMFQSKDMPSCLKRRPFWQTIGKKNWLQLMTMLSCSYEYSWVWNWWLVPVHSIIVYKFKIPYFSNKSFWQTIGKRIGYNLWPRYRAVMNMKVMVGPFSFHYNFFSKFAIFPWQVLHHL